MTGGATLDERARTVLLRVGAAGTAFGCLVGLGVVLQSPAPALLPWWGSLGAAGSGLAFAAARRAPRLAAFLFFLVVLGVLTGVGAAAGNCYPATASLSLLVVMLAGLLVSRRAAAAMCAVAVACALGLGVADAAGMLPPESLRPLDRVLAVVLSIVVGTVVFVVALGRLERAHAASREHAAEMAAMAASLERIVAERTSSLVAARDAAEAASRAKSAFLANVSHELRTPLNAVVGLLEVLRGRPRPDEEAALFSTMERSVDALLAVIDDTLELARLEAGRLSVQPEACAPQALVQGVIDLLQGAAARDGLALTVAYADDVPALVVTDPRRLRQILLNLVSNAIKFTPQGAVRVEVRRDGDDRLSFAIIDTGVGIALEDQPRLFQPFGQIDASRARAQSGVGLGLAICRHLVELLGGSIGVQSAPGQGSTFRFTVVAPPATSTDTATSAPTSTGRAAPLWTDLSAPALPPWTQLRFLIVEDNAVNRTVLSHMMRRLGVVADAVDGGAAALARLAEGDVDALLLDVQMPDIDGLEVTRRLVAAGGRRPWIIAVTAHALPDEEAAARQAGVDDYLTKPVRLEALQAALERAASSSR